MTYDLFLTHDWGSDGKSNHIKVAKINDALTKAGYVTWFDSERLTGNYRHQMASGIDNSKCILVFVTKRYHDKVVQGSEFDNCKLEFDYASLQKPMVAIVMEKCMQDTSSWRGNLGLTLAKKLYVNFSGNIDDKNYMNSQIKTLAKELEVFGIQPELDQTKLANRLNNNLKIDQEKRIEPVKVSNTTSAPQSKKQNTDSANENLAKCLKGVTIALKSCHGNYFCAEENGNFVVNRKEKKGWEKFVVEHHGSNKISLKTYHHKYVCSEADGKLIANRVKAALWEQFFLESLPNGKIALMSCHTTRYMCAEPNGRAIGDRLNKGPWEEFTFEKCKPESAPLAVNNALKGLTQIALKSHHGKYLCAEQSGKVVADRVKRQGWETFDVKHVKDHVIALKSAHNKYVCAEPNFNIIANRDVANAWERFTVETVSNGKIALVSCHTNRYLCAEPNGRVVGHRTKRGPWEEFNVEKC